MWINISVSLFSAEWTASVPGGAYAHSPPHCPHLIGWLLSPTSLHRASLAPPWPAAWAGIPLHHSGHSSCPWTSSSTTQHRLDHKRVFLIWNNHAGSLVELPKHLPPIWEKVMMWWGGHLVFWLPLLRPRDPPWHGTGLEMAEQASLRLSTKCLGHHRPPRAQQRDLTQSPSARQRGFWPTPASNCHSPNCHSELCFSVPAPVPACPSNDCWLRSQHGSLRTGWKPHCAIQVSNRCSFIRQPQLSLTLVPLVLVSRALRILLPLYLLICGIAGEPTWLFEHLLTFLSCMWRLCSSEGFGFYQKEKYFIYPRKCNYLFNINNKFSL